jgi:alkylation response protein AidB-like acyl-CoA dehydrogenase
VHAPGLVFVTDIGSRLVARLVREVGGADRQALLDPIQRGEWIVSLGVSDPAGSQSTRAEPLANGYRLDGRKAQVALASIADVIAVSARLTDGWYLFLVDRGASGLSVGERISTVGYQTLCPAPIGLEKVQVGKDRVLGPLPEDPHVLVRECEDMTFTATSLGLLRRCVEHAKESADRPRAGGRPPAANQAVRFSLAEMLTLLQTAEILAYRAFAAVSDGDREATSLLQCAKVFATEAACQVSEQAMQIMGISGYVKGNPVERAFRQARLGTILGHSSRAARMSIADAILARY